MIDATKITKFLGTSIKFVPSRTDNVHTAKKKNNEYDVQDHHQIEITTNNSPHHQNAKILSSSAPEGFSWIIVDYDDKQKTGKIPDLSKVFNLKETFSVKTPTGAGRQDWYLITDEQAQRLPTNKYKFPEFPQVDILIGHKNTKQLFVAPGSKKNDGEYVLKTAMNPVNISDKLFNALLVQASMQKSIIDQGLHKNLHSFNTKIDEQQNKRQYLEYINSRILEFELGDKVALDEGDGRDALLFGYICQGFTYNLSPEIVKEIMSAKVIYNPQVIVDTVGEYNEEYLDIKIKSAYSYIVEQQRNDERTISKDLDLFQEDEYGKRVVHRDILEKKVLHLSKYELRKIIDNDELRTMLCETIVYDSNSGQYYVANMMSHNQYEKEYKKSINRENKFNEQINIQRLLSLYSNTVLHWTVFKPQHIKEKYKKNKGRNKSITDWPEFRESFSCNISDYKPEENIIIEDNTFYPETKSPIEPIPYDEVTKEEFDKIKALLKTHLNRIVDSDNFNEEASWLLDRYSILLKDPDAKIDNAIILKGSQGSGKTTLIEVLMLLFPRQDSTLILDVDSLESRFTQYSRVTHIDDINVNVDKKVMNHIKALVTTSQVPVEKKFQDTVQTIQMVNISMSTNQEITDEEVLFGRRWTIFINDSLFVIEDVAKETRQMFIDLKADNWRLFKVLHTYLLNRDTSNFKSDYKTKAQKQLILERRKGSDFSIALANMIANYGYISPEIQVVVPKELLNRSDLVVLITSHYNNIENTKHAEDLKFTKGTKLRTLFDEDFYKRKRIHSVFVDLFNDSNERTKSKINESINPTWANKVPNIRQWIELLTVSLMDSRSPDMIKHIVEVFHFEEQWKWDNMSKPEVEDLGTINAYENVDIDELDDDY